MTNSEWTPEFDGQRPPFAAGNTTALVHGARSEATVAELAGHIAADLLARPDCPAHLHEPLFQSSIAAWSRAEAMVSLLWDYVSGQDVKAAITEVTTGIETEEAERKGKITRRSAAKRVTSALDQLRRYETHAANLRARLGLDPASAARIGRDIAAGRHYGNATPLDQAVAELARQRALQAAPAQDGDDDDSDDSQPG